MKILFVIIILFFVSIATAFGAISDSTGLREVLEIKSGGYTFDVETVGNYNIENYEFNKDEKRLTLLIHSGLENNLGEIVLPTNLLGGNLTFYLNDEMISPDVKHTNDISFITLSFLGNGTNKLDIFGTEYLSSLDEIIIECSDGYKLVDGICKYVQKPDSNGGGCLIATAAFGSELAPQVQFLREVRDNTVMSTGSGMAFMSTFNQLYYSFSPTIADMQRENPAFKESVKLFITPMISTLSIMTLADEGSESDVLAAGISVILLNLGMYLIGPGLAIVWLKKRL